MKQTFALLAATGLTVTGLAALSPAPAQAANCTAVSSHTATSRGSTVARAEWRRCYSNGYVRVTGWLRDEKQDGRCARIDLRFTDGAEEYLQTCGYKSEKALVSGWHAGRVAVTIRRA